MEDGVLHCSTLGVSLFAPEVEKSFHLVEVLSTLSLFLFPEIVLHMFIFI